ncbi:unnamed protein product, partial [Thlaspi arvense]
MGCNLKEIVGFHGLCGTKPEVSERADLIWVTFSSTRTRLKTRKQTNDEIWDFNKDDRGVPFGVGRQSGEGAKVRGSGSTSRESLFELGAITGGTDIAHLLFSDDRQSLIRSQFKGKINQASPDLNGYQRYISVDNVVINLGLAVCDLRNQMITRSMWFQGRQLWQGVVQTGSESIRGKAKQALRLKTIVLRFDNTELITGYTRTHIGRCMNPGIQDINSLMLMLPQIWKVEDRVAGADLGMGHFQFDFDEEDDITAVLKWSHTILMDGWWCWFDGSHRWSQITHPLLPFGCPGGGTGVETIVLLHYERLHGFFRERFSLCHESACCPLLYPKRERAIESHFKEDKEDEGNSGGTSYKGALQGKEVAAGPTAEMKQTVGDSHKGKGKVTENREENASGCNPNSLTQPSAKKVRKELAFDEVGLEMDDLGQMIDQVIMANSLDATLDETKVWLACGVILVTLEESGNDQNVIKPPSKAGVKKKLFKGSLALGGGSRKLMHVVTPRKKGITADPKKGGE